MDENEQTKICPLCAETIKAAAKVCPYCRKPQGRKFHISEHDAAAFLSIIAFIGLFYVAFTFSFTGRQYSPANHSISVLNSNCGIEMDEDDTNVVVSGFVTNSTRFSWTMLDMECRFLDANGRTIEVSHGHDDAMFAPKTEQSYKIKLYELHKMPAFNTLKVSVVGAKDPRSWLSD